MLEDKNVKDAANYVKSYIVFNGGSPYEDVDWEHKPKNLPHDVSVAWDIVLEFQEELIKKGVEY